MAEYASLASLPIKEIERLRRLRWKARTDLGFLCREVLGYVDVSDNNFQPGHTRDKAPKLPIHQPLIDTVQKFPVPTREQRLEHDQLINGVWRYKPLMPITSLPGKRRTLILDARGFLKTTINTMAHAIQWIINYPDVSIMVVQSNGAKAEVFISEIKQHFVGNENFRNLFPEHVPWKNVTDYGTRAYFTTLARNPAVIKREPTVLASSIDKGMAGYHFEVIKCSDIVDPSNITGQGLQDVKRSFNYLQPLLISPSYWIDVEGTRYHSDDTYGAIIEQETSAEEHEKQYNMYIRSCYQRVIPGDAPPKFNLEELKLPFKCDEKGVPLSWWPERFESWRYERMKKDDPFVFATQQLNDPSAASGTKPFPVIAGKLPHYVPAKIFHNLVPIGYREIVVDTAETTGKRSDYTVLTVAAWDKTSGRVYIEDIQRGRYLPDEMVRKLILLCVKYRPRTVKIEETGFVRGMMSSITRAIDIFKREYDFPTLSLQTIKRDNQEAKTERILHTLQPWYVSGDIRFLDDLNTKCPGVIEAMEKEFSDFPSAKNDDILDTLSDCFQNKKHFGIIRERHTPESIASKMKRAQERWQQSFPYETGEESTGNRGGYEL